MLTYYFHVSSEAREKYKFSDQLFSIEGDLIVAHPTAARNISDKINSVRKPEGKIDELVTPGEINAAGLLHEIFHFIMQKYEKEKNPGVFTKGLSYISSKIDETDIEKTLLQFVKDFPPLEVYQKKVTPEKYLSSKTEDKPNREIIYEELILLHLENINPALKKLKELFSDDDLIKTTKYKEFIEQSEEFFAKEEPIGKGNGSLLSFLKMPMMNNPENILDQIDFIRDNWNIELDQTFINKLLLGKDLISEDLKLFVKHDGGEKATPPVPFYKSQSAFSFASDPGATTSSESDFTYEETESFTPDIEWMPNVVMLAKNVFVWMFQLSHKYEREIKTLDQIPDEELDQIANWNFNALWLIGIWDRSSASRKVKQLTGNPEAAPSAYSLFDYVIAEEIGGESAFQNLKDRCGQRGIRMASDMVPNHTGIYSKWVVEHPEFFIQSDKPPYPSYRFTGPNLSDDERVEVRIEDQYYQRTDAAVVFERRDRHTGDVRYIYHGNDGTNMAWNDTAQLNLLIEEVRETLIQTIKHVARKTPIIRFDAAMTLTKKHFQRLWFPQPGSGGAIPSRSDHSLTRTQFDNLMPKEFWREVVDRMNNEMPQTLLLAEAFWLMEGYFVRTLGMHRVYNSAFMHMLMKEENDKYRLLIKNTLSFNPEILKRYVNFMSNPDEETAINQFGKGDKYFGVATLLLTLPGLPMFAHGQVEGYSEKYGMEYKRAYYNESPDHELIIHHEYALFPLIHKRYLFSEVENFELYDFVDPEGKLNENVFAFSNSKGDENTIVLYNNSYQETTGRIVTAVEKFNTYKKKITKTHIAEALGMNTGVQFFYSFYDHSTKLEYLRSGMMTHGNGLSFYLGGYQTKVLLNFREIQDFDGKYRKLFNQLSGEGVLSIDEALKEMEFANLHKSITELITADIFSDTDEPDDKVLINKDPETIISSLSSEITNELRSANVPANKNLEEDLLNNIKCYRNFENELAKYRKKGNKRIWSDHFLSSIPDLKNEEKNNDDLFKTSLIINSLFNGKTRKNIVEDLHKIMLWKPVENRITLLNTEWETSEAYTLLLLLLEISNSENGKKENSGTEQKFLNKLNELIKDDKVSKLIQVNTYEGTEYFNRENYLKLVSWLILVDSYSFFKKEVCNKDLGKSSKKIIPEFRDHIKSLNNFYKVIVKQAEESEFHFDKIKTIEPVSSKKKKTKKKQKITRKNK